jgi:uncharacterized protein (UPF0147 family)
MSEQIQSSYRDTKENVEQLKRIAVATDQSVARFIRLAVRKAVQQELKKQQEETK